MIRINSKLTPIYLLFEFICFHSLFPLYCAIRSNDLQVSLLFTAFTSCGTKMFLVSTLSILQGLE